MRKLGQSLCVVPMAVYHYIPNKAALLDALVEAVMKEIRLPDNFLSMEPRNAIAEAARSYWSALHAHPRAVSVLASRPALNEGSLGYVEKSLPVCRLPDFPNAGLWIPKVTGMMSFLYKLREWKISHRFYVSFKSRE